MTEKPKTGRTTPPTDDEWTSIWPAIDKSEKSWIIIGPIHAAVTNWRAWLVISGIVAYIRGDEIILAIKAIVGGPV